MIAKVSPVPAVRPVPQPWGPLANRRKYLTNKDLQIQVDFVKKSTNSPSGRLTTRAA